MRDLSTYGFANNSRHSRRLSRLLKPQTDGTGPPGVNDNGLTLYDISRVLWFLKVCLLLTFRSQKRKMKLYHWTDRRKRLLALSICKNTGLMAISKELVYMAKKKENGPSRNRLERSDFSFQLILGRPGFNLFRWQHVRAECMMRQFLKTPKAYMVRQFDSLARPFAHGAVNGIIFLFPPEHVVNYQAVL